MLVVLFVVLFALVYCWKPEAIGYALVVFFALAMLVSVLFGIGAGGRGERR